MRLLDVLIGFDAALDWPLDDPFLADHEPAVQADGSNWAPASELGDLDHAS